jgi:hypothetical protein
MGIFARFRHKVYGKKISLGRWEYLQKPERKGVDFASAQNFQDLFALLDTKGALWGSQRCYTARELKVLINRVRTKNLAFCLPLQVIPETGGLRQRVKALCDAERETSPTALPFFGEKSVAEPGSLFCRSRLGDCANTE